MRNVLAFAALLFLSMTPHAQASPPNGFSSETLQSLSFFATDLAYGPGGKLFIGDKAGKIWIYHDGELHESPALSLKVSSDKERGLSGFALHPDFSKNGHAYVYYTTGAGSKKYSGSPKNRLSRFTFAQATETFALSSEKILVDNIASDAGYHNAGAVLIGPDRKVYVSTGDGGIHSKNSQTLSNLNGKILRYNLDGTVPSDNPFVNTAGAKGGIWAYGFRNPWRMAFDAKTELLVAADVGAADYEELNVVEKGKNYGWPITEGPSPAGVSGVTYPAYAYKREKKDAAIIGGVFYRGSTFPSHYRGRYFFGDFGGNFIKSVSFDPDGLVTGIEKFDTDSGWMIDMVEAPDGALNYIIADGPTTSHIHRVQYTGSASSGASVVAKMSTTTKTGALPHAVRFLATGSTPKAKSYIWDFGDGTNGRGTGVTHVYRRRGTYTATLTVTTADGSFAKTSAHINAGYEKPNVVIARTDNNPNNYRAGDKLSFSVAATDASGAPIASTSVTWSVLFHHNTHFHPFLGPISGKEKLSFSIPENGESSANVWFSVHASVKDRDGITRESVINIYPKKTTLDVRANIEGVTLTIDGSPKALPFKKKNVVRFARMISVPETVDVGGVAYTFVRWSDGGAREHTLIPRSDQPVLTAEYAVQ